MKKCICCGKPISIWTSGVLDGMGNLVTGMCSDCRRRPKQEPHHASAQAGAIRQDELPEWARCERIRRAIHGRDEPSHEPLDGSVLVGLSLIFGGFAALAIRNGVGSGVLFAQLILGIGGVICSAGVIRWAVSGAQFVQMDRIQKQNVEIIELLELLGARSEILDDVQKLHVLRESGLLGEVEFRKQRRLLMKK